MEGDQIMEAISKAYDIQYAREREICYISFTSLKEKIKQWKR